MIDLMPLAEVLNLLSPDTNPEQGTDVRDVLEEKRTDKDYPALLEAIRRDGITIPILITPFSGDTLHLADGHHRVAAAMDLGMDMVPWTDDATLESQMRDMEWKVRPGVIDEHAMEAFKHGACGGLAIALHDATGWPIIAVGACDGLDMHYMVRTPAGQLLDIEGLRVDDDVTTEYEFDADDGIVTLTETTRENVWAWYHGEECEPVPMDVVRTIASAVLLSIK